MEEEELQLVVVVVVVVGCRFRVELVDGPNP